MPVSVGIGAWVKKKPSLMASKFKAAFVATLPLVVGVTADNIGFMKKCQVGSCMRYYHRAIRKSTKRQ